MSIRTSPRRAATRYLETRAAERYAVIGGRQA
jgi:hypothetical protein